MDAMHVETEDQNRPKVLVADDERMIADTLRTILNQNGFDAASAYDGQDAIDMARVWPPNILLTDVIMPNVNGIEAAIQITRMIPACRVLLFSGDAGTPDLRHDAQARGHRFQLLVKPLHPEELLAILRRL
jgi:CheY-like chemotaxis protein